MLVVLAGCGEDSLDPLAERAEHVRELQFFESVDVVSMSRDDYAAQAAANAANIDHERLFEYAQTYGRLGFFDISLDLVPIIAGSNSDWVGASYSPSSKRITLVGGADDDTLVHEYVHALQDQHFDIGAYDLYATSDGFLARRAIVEGDAMLAQYRFIMQDEHDIDLDGLDWQAAFANLRDFSDGIVSDSDYPPVFLDYPSFCYAYGLEHDAHNLTGVRYGDAEALQPGPYDWSREDELFTQRAPDTTQQVLRLSIADEVDPVVALGSAVPAAHADRFEAVDVDSLGEWTSYLLLLGVDGEMPAARVLAAAWDGDRADFLRDTDSGEYAVVWSSVWDDAAGASAIAEAMWSLYGRRPTLWQPFLFALADDGEPVWIELRGDRLVVIKNLPPPLMPAFAEQAFTPPATAARLVRRKPSLAQFVSELPHLAH